MQTIVLIPGLLCDERLWSRQLQDFGLRGPVSVPDITQQASIGEMAKAILGNAPERFALAGFSLGSQIALEMVRAAPARIERLALLSATRGGLLPPVRAAMEAAITMIAQQGLEVYLENAFPTYFTAEHVRDPAFKQLFFDMAHVIGGSAGVRQMQALLQIEAPFSDLDQISCKTLVLGGSEDRRTTPAAHQALAQAIPGSRLILLRGAAHFTPLEQPDGVSRALSAWLDY